MPTEAWLRLLNARGGPTWRKAVVEAASPEALLAQSDAALEAAGLSAESLSRLRHPDSATLDTWRRWLDEPQHALITLGSPGYPELLASIPDPPIALWINGSRPELLQAAQIAIVGSRNASHGGRATAEDFAQYLSGRGLTITSGLAAGIDAASHTGALGQIGSTVAVFGCGIDTVFPRENHRLAHQVAAEGVLVSEYPPGVPPLPRQFPERNRIIAGLSLGTLVVEAGRRSGSLITARLAIELGREVFAIPGSIHNPLARGCHYLIRQGAKLVEEGADILVELAPLLQVEMPPAKVTPEPAQPSILDDPAYQNLLKILGFEPARIGDLAARTALTTAELSSMLLLLELEGLVEALPGGLYCCLPTRSR